MALFNIALQLAKKGDQGDNEAGAAHQILTKALRAPIESIIANSGQSAIHTIADIEAVAGGWKGFNAMTNHIDDLKAAGVIDPLKVTKTAFLNALSVASNYLMIGAAVTDIPKKEEPGAGGMPGMGGGMGY
jgi:chaperonin GroEL